MPTFIYRVRLPFAPGIEEKGRTSKKEFLSFVQNFYWDDLLKSIEGVHEDDIINSPAIEVENVEEKKFFRLSNSGNCNHHHFFVSYIRPYTRKLFFGLLRYFYPSYLTFKMSQELPDVLKDAADFFDGKLTGF